MGLRVFLVAPSTLLTDHLAHGDGLVAFGFCRELAARGHELHVAAGRVAIETNLPSNFQLHALERSLRPRLSRLDFMRRTRRLYARLTRERPFDLIHQLNPVEVGVSLALAGVAEPLVLGPYVPDWPGAGGASAAVRKLLRAAQQRRASTVLLSSPAASSKLDAGGRGDLAVAEVPPGIDPRLWVPGQRDPGQDVLFLASLEARKGIHVALDAFSRISAELPAARLLVAGAGTEAGAVRERVRRLPAPGRVQLLGPIEHRLVGATMQACDVYCLPSYGEPFGMTALEAMACGKPVVATDAGGLGHLVSPRGGRTVPPGDAQALAQALHELLVRPELRQAMGEHNRRIVEERYSWSRVVDRLEERYVDAMRRRATS